MTQSGSCDDDYGLDEIVLVPLPADRHGGVAVPPGLIVSPHELATAQRLAVVGFDVWFNALSHEPGVKNPDVTIDDQIWEMKSPQGAGKNTVAHQFARAAEQSDRLVIDGARSALPDNDVLDQIRRRLAGSKKFTEAMHVAKSAIVTRLTRDDMV
ncbi:CdiA C-terminal domain-containing protein [Promicromonospora soli]